MIVSFRDKRTGSFFEGERVKAFQGFSSKPCYASTGLLQRIGSWRLTPRETGLKALGVIGKASTAFASTTSGGCASNGRKTHRGLLTWK